MAKSAYTDHPMFRAEETVNVVLEEQDITTLRDGETVSVPIALNEMLFIELENNG